MTKAANKRAIKALPALRASLLWFKRETVRQLHRGAEEAASPRLRAYERDPNGREYVFYRRGDGSYKASGKRLALGVRSSYHDYSF